MSEDQPRRQTSDAELFLDPKVIELVDGLSIEPRAYQARIALQTMSLFEHGCEENPLPAESVLIESPTGSGKTVMGLMIARKLQREFGFRVGWVAMRRNLLKQAAAENLDKGFNVELNLISMFDKNPPDVDLLVVDEAQHDAAMSMANLHGEVKPQKILGLSATPYRHDRIKLCFQHVIRDADIFYLVQSGYLSRYRHFTIGKYDPQSVAECYAREPERWGQSLIFFHRRENCLECQRQLERHGIKAEVVTAQTDRERQIEDFINGKTQILLSMMILTEGFDCPSLQTVFCRPSGKACTIQMGGRVLRTHRDLAHKQIVQCRDTRCPFPRVATPDEQYTWSETGWKSLKLNPHLEEISQNTLNLIAQAEVKLPEFLSKKRKQTNFWNQQNNPNF